jgi:hypothetical protein
MGSFVLLESGIVFRDLERAEDRAILDPLFLSDLGSLLLLC